MKIIINEYAPERSRALKRWFPEATVCRRFENESTPDSFDLLVLSGGPKSAHEQSRIERPFLAEDLLLLHELHDLQCKSPFVLGICLGAQLMTFAFGGHVVDGDTEIVGWNPLQIVGHHPAFEGIQRPFHCEIHSNHISKIPDGARIVASSNIDEVEVFSVGDRFLATAYHPEFIEEDIVWFAKNTDYNLQPFLQETDLSLKDASLASEMFFKNIRSLV